MIRLPLNLYTRIITGLLLCFSSSLFAHNFLIETNEKALDIQHYLSLQNSQATVNNIYQLQKAIELLKGDAKKQFIADLKISKTNLQSSSGPVSGTSNVIINQLRYRINNNGELALDENRRHSLFEQWSWR